MHAIPASQLRSLHARIAGILAEATDEIALRVSDGSLHVTARSNGERCRFEVDLRDPDAELVLLAKLTCFVERARGPTS